MPEKCVENQSCGWCGDRSSCIPGTSRGPLSPCLRNTFIFDNSSKNWNPLKASTININHGGAVIQVPNPHMDEINVNKPYN